MVATASYRQLQLPLTDCFAHGMRMHSQQKLFKTIVAHDLLLIFITLVNFNEWMWAARLPA